MQPLRLLALAFVLPACGLLANDDELPPPGMTEYWTPQPTVVSAPNGGVPSDAIVLFDGTDLDAWQLLRREDAPLPANWIVEDGVMTVPPKAKGDPSNTIETRQHFGDVQLHLEWRAPASNGKDGQARGNSGVFFMGRYEVQILDCYENQTYVNGMTASVYKQHPPLVNACRAPGEWQTYDIIFEAPRFSPDGTLLKKARVTVIHNGIVVQHATVIDGPSVYRGLPSYSYHSPRQPIYLQDHNDPISFRNIWVRELDLP